MSLQRFGSTDGAASSAKFLAAVILLVATSGSLLRASDTRLPLPDAATRATHEKSIDEVFGAQIAAAKTPAAKVAVAEEILKVARDEPDAQQRYAMLNRVRTLGCAAGDARTALLAVGELVKSFQVDRGRGELATLQAVASAATTPAQQLLLAQSAMPLLEEAAARDELTTAAEMGQVALAAAQKSGNATLQQKLSGRVQELQTLVQAASQLQPLRERLAKNADDPEANQALGRYYCFARGDWKTGLPLLAKATDPSLKAAAGKELAKPKDGNDLLQLADLWWNLGEQEKDAQQTIRTHAIESYRQAFPNLTGLNKVRVEKRLKEFDEQLAKTSPADTRLEKDPRSPAGTATGTSSQKALLEYAAAQVKAKNTESSKEVGFTLGKEVFSLVPEEGQLLIGVDVSIGTFNKISGIRPIFLSAKGQVAGPVVGEVSQKGARLLAKKGYAIGAIIVKGGIGIDGLSVTFMKIEDNRLNPQDAYDTPAFGNSAGGTALGGDGVPIVGLIGHHDTKSVTAIGIVQAVKSKEDKVENSK